MKNVDSINANQDSITKTISVDLAHPFVVHVNHKTHVLLVKQDSTSNQHISMERQFIFVKKSVGIKMQ